MVLKCYCLFLEQHKIQLSLNSSHYQLKQFFNFQFQNLDYYYLISDIVATKNVMAIDLVVLKFEFNYQMASFKV